MDSGGESKYEALCTVADRGVSGIYIVYSAVYIYYLSIGYLVYSCDVSPLLQEQGANVVTAFPDCIVQCSLAKLQ